MIVKDVMCHDLLTVPPDMLVSELGLYLTDHNISGAPVLEKGKLVGVVSLRDIAASVPSEPVHEPRRGHAYFRDLWAEDEARGFVVEHSGSASVRDIMTPAVYTIAGTASLNSLVDMMRRSSIHRVIVVNDLEVPIGIVTTTDMMRLIPLLLPQSTLAPS